VNDREKIRYVKQLQARNLALDPENKLYERFQCFDELDACDVHSSGSWFLDGAMFTYTFNRESCGQCRQCPESIEGLFFRELTIDCVGCGNQPCDVWPETVHQSMSTHLYRGLSHCVPWPGAKTDIYQNVVKVELCKTQRLRNESHQILISKVADDLRVQMNGYIGDTKSDERALGAATTRWFGTNMPYMDTTTINQLSPYIVELAMITTIAEAATARHLGLESN
jgi:hypothetical protein